MLPLERTARTSLAISDRLPASKLPAPFTTAFVIPPVAQPAKVTADADIYDITMKSFREEVIPGYKTELWGYNGSVPGPTIRVRKGREAVVRHTNSLPAAHPDLRYKPWTSVHLHGSASLPQYDGYASDITNPGEYKDYRYPNIQDARTLWYHDHGVHHTSSNAYMGLFAQYQMSDAVEDSLPIPKGRYDVPLLISDAMFANDGSLLFDTEGDSSLYGDVITLVPLRPQHRRPVHGHRHRRWPDAGAPAGDPISPRHGRAL
jgi:FtsP/CotA-like multicopper oxidase with cupredoxin domain